MTSRFEDHELRGLEQYSRDGKNGERRKESHAATSWPNHWGKHVNTAVFQKQLDSILQDFVAMQRRSTLKDLSDLPREERQALVTRALASIHRITGKESAYASDAARIIQVNPALHVHTTSIMGVAQALRDDLAAGYTKSLVEIVHAEVFADFLEMAEHLTESGYKDAGAVIAGSTLEGHLRGLCQKSGIPTVKTGTTEPKKADSMNTELAAAGAYSKLDQKNVTAWLDLRNKAAHGDYAKYNKDQVTLLIAGIRDFISRNPA